MSDDASEDDSKECPDDRACWVLLAGMGPCVPPATCF